MKFEFDHIFGHPINYCPYPSIRDWIAVYPAVVLDHLGGQVDGTMAAEVAVVRFGAVTYELE